MRVFIRTKLASVLLNKLLIKLKRVFAAKIINYISMDSFRAVMMRVSTGQVCISFHRCRQLRCQSSRGRTDSVCFGLFFLACEQSKHV